jgi:hypothetical protein
MRREYLRMVDAWPERERLKWLGKMHNLGSFPMARGTGWYNHLDTILASLRADLSNNTKSMGWEVFVLAHVFHEVNIILLPVVQTPNEIFSGITPVLIPGELNADWPIIVLYHRSHYSYDDPADSSGHYEVLFYQPAAEFEPVTSMFSPQHIAYHHLTRIAAQALSSTAQDRARASMVAYDALSVNNRVWAQDDVVGVSTRTLKRTAKLPAHNIVGVVAQVVETSPGHPAYRVLTEHGLIDTLLPTHCLVTITEGNPQVVPTVTLLRDRLAQVANRESATLKAACLEVTIAQAHARDLAKRGPPAPVASRRTQPSRARTLTPLADAAAAASAVEDAIQVTQQAAQHMVRIVGERRLEYHVEWSLPEAQPERTWQRKTQLDSRLEYMSMVQRWRRQQDEEAGYDVSEYPPITP